MKRYFSSLRIILAIMLFMITACSPLKQVKIKSLNYKELHDKYPNIINISLTPDLESQEPSCFTDYGAWMGFTMPQKEKWINGFCGPYSIGGYYWFAQSVVEVGIKNQPSVKWDMKSSNYFPSEIYLSSSSTQGKIEQRINFVDSSTAILRISSTMDEILSFTGRNWNEASSIKVDGNHVIAKHFSGESLLLTFPAGINVSQQDKNYIAETTSVIKEVNVAISFIDSESKLSSEMRKATTLLTHSEKKIKDCQVRWNDYIQKVLRDDMTDDHNRIAVKSVVTLIANWRSPRGDLLHQGVIPSYSFNHFVGFWSWDSWRISVALAKFFPDLAKDNIRAMFDYQLSDGMIPDCIFVNKNKNNLRNTKAPLACWAVDEVYKHTQDKDFVKEMYPKLLAYYKFWFNKRDHDHNRICEFGSTDGTLEAAAWESGMDNAIRFDNAKMLKNSADAWSLDQESIDLNSYLVVEGRLLNKFAKMLNIEFDYVDHSNKVASYFFNENLSFFCDRKIASGRFIEEIGCEGYAPFWAEVATKGQMERAYVLLNDTAKFSTYIPFPTIAADNPKYSLDGYWRGPVWLDQTYFAIKGLRNYGYKMEADNYTLQVFDRLQGLKKDAAIYENYDTRTGIPLRAANFSWSAAHLLMLYEDYNR